MKRCTLFLSTAGGSSPYGTFTNITTDQTSGVCRQIWHTYLNEQQGSLGSLGLCRDNRSGKPAPQLHYSAKTHSTFIIRFISARARSSFAQGQQKTKRRFSFFSPRNKCTWHVGILSFGVGERKQTPDSSKKGRNCVPGIQATCNLTGWGKPSDYFCNSKKSYNEKNKTWLLRIKWVLLLKTRYLHPGLSPIVTLRHSQICTLSNTSAPKQKVLVHANAVGSQSVIKSFLRSFGGFRPCISLRKATIVYE